ncbi:DNA-directed RNA polymerase subunit beta', partial [Datura stramonium]|nr:DNA-directed RNA polymerase subunit beta' [Datura stramonium]
MEDYASSKYDGGDFDVDDLAGICACGNYRVIGDEKEDPKFCEQCGVEFVDSRIRRYQMGYIKLGPPLVLLDSK